MDQRGLPTGCAQREVSAQATMRMKQSLKSSEGCTESGPTRIQRRAPETVRPSTKTATRRAEADRGRRRGGSGPAVGSRRWPRP